MRDRTRTGFADRTRARRVLLRCALALQIGLLFALPQTLAARTPAAAYTIAAGPLRLALVLFARQSGVQILFAPELVAGKQAPPLTGRHTIDEALTRLLAGSGLSARKLDSGAILIVPASPAAPPLVSSHDRGPEGAPPQGLESPRPDILVTAFKYPTLLAQSAADLTVIGAQLQRQRGIDGLATLAQATPSLNIAQNNSAASRLTLRGVYGRGEPTVGVYYGDSPVSGPSGTTFDPGGIALDLELVDLARIEVLRGPQGTLYGASSMGGTLRFLFNTPDATEASGEIRGGASITRHGSPGHHVSAMINLPLASDTLALRAVAYDRTTGGYIDHPRFALADQGGAERQGGRIALAWTPGPDLDLKVSFFHQETRSDGAQFFDDRGGARTNDLAVRTPNANTLNLANAALDWRSDWGTLTALATFYRWKVLRQSDFSDVIAGLVDNPASCLRHAGLGQGASCTQTQWEAYRAFVATRLPAILYQPMWVTSANGEVRFHTEALARTSLTLGLFAETRRDRVDSITARADAASGLLVRPLDVTGARAIWTALNQTALFGEASYDLSPRVRLTAGLRLFHYGKTARGDIFTPNLITGTADIAPGRFSTRESGSNLKLQATWRPSPDLVAYLQMADGFRPGGVNITPSLSEENRSYAADALRSYEVGLRLGLPRAGIELQGALYHIGWSDMIYNASSPNSAFVYNTNIGSIAIDGAEVNAHWQASDELALALSASWTDARVARDQERAGTLGQLFAGDRVPMIPRLAASLGLAYERRLASGTTLWGRLDAVASSGFASQFNTLQSSYARTLARASLDLAAGVERGGWDLSLSLRNALDTHRPEQVLATSLGARQVFAPRPRTLALELGVTF
ncbi:TonB-dependent receptor domain-containing protein [Novosphingobium decolorationis]|uniref:TonB-dependent receptor n=1 Tax=Novosphingobium decolorationis TaxID=2698673 RepID=A0ABX8E451_9SPHN|nr:TonB-dependent receptor [Novosphingobium decolorationis]QVM83006.1 TonB-dependent receptor [Novosphingobium decolorationis]